MKKVVFIFPAFIFLIAVSCNNSGEKNQGNGGETKTRADSLMDDVMEGHNIGMGKMGKLSTMENKVQKAIDSINNLSEKAKKSLRNFQSGLEILLVELKSAEEGMNKWMDEFNMDSAKNNNKLRIQYLESEKIKVSKVKESILNALQKTDSLLKH
jgi:soluble cytochrome b562